jgi:hypothetical protein
MRLSDIILFRSFFFLFSSRYVAIVLISLALYLSFCVFIYVLFHLFIYILFSVFRLFYSVFPFSLFSIKPSADDCLQSLPAVFDIRSLRVSGLPKDSFHILAHSTSHAISCSALAAVRNNRVGTATVPFVNMF